MGKVQERDQELAREIEKRKSKIKTISITHTQRHNKKLSLFYVKRVIINIIIINKIYFLPGFSKIHLTRLLNIWD
jgi:hypothetical protein